MLAHPTAGERIVIEFDVAAADILDLRDPSVLARARLVGDPFADWQPIVAAGGTPSSWLVRDWAVRQGAQGLIDPSRQAPGLWHLVLFGWNAPGCADVSEVSEI